MSVTIRTSAGMAVLLAALAAFAAKDFAMPRTYHAKTYPARDEHKQELVTVAADPYDTGDKQQIFSADYREHGILPVLLVITNDSDQPITLLNLDLTLVTVRRDKLPAATLDEIARRIQRQMKRPDAPRRSPVPLPLPRRSSPSVPREVRDELDAAMFHAKAVEPHATAAGFVFFDYTGISNPLAGARLICSGLKNSDGQELFFFEIPMEKYLTYQPGKMP